MTALTILTAALLGSVHALEPDHMAAVTSFAVRRPRPVAAASFGIRWAAGHGAVVLLIGTLLLAAGLAIPTATSAWLDRLTGIVLVLLGGWTFLHARRLHAHAHVHGTGVAHVHLHSHVIKEAHDHTHAPMVVGALHGLAGAAPAIALLQLPRLGSIMLGLIVLFSFALGTALAMAAYAYLAGFVFDQTALRSQRWARGLGGITGIATMVIGALWLI